MPSYYVAGGAAVARAPATNGQVDPNVTPQNDAEREAVRDALKQLREKKGDARVRGTFVSSSPRSARITVKLPADARLFVDNVKCPLASATRSFNTPALQPGRDYYYTLRAEITRNGERRVENQRVVIAAGRTVTVEFKNFSSPRVAQR